jgi:hypothetical protein
MANDNPAVNIPDLKKKEKERKKAGAAWSGARGAAGEFSGATGGNVAASAAGLGEGAGALGGALEGAGALGAESGGLFAGIADSLGLGEAWTAMTSTLLGKVALAAAAFSMAAGAGVLGSMLRGKGAAGMAGSMNLGGIVGAFRVHPGGGDRLGVDSRGEIRFDPLSASNQPAPPTDAKTAGENSVPGTTSPSPDTNADRNALNAPPFGAFGQNGQPFGDLGGGASGGKNISAGGGSPNGASASQSGGGGGGGGGNSPSSAVKGQLSAASAAVHATASTRSMAKWSATSAFGQLKMANGMSQFGQTAAASGSIGSEAASAGALGAFEQQQTSGGGLTASAGAGTSGGAGSSGGSTGSSGGGQTPTTLGSGAPSFNVSPDIPNAPAAVEGKPGIELQSVLDQISSLLAASQHDKQMGGWEVWLGYAGLGIGALGADVFMGMSGAALVAYGYYTEDTKARQEEAQAQSLALQLKLSLADGNEYALINACLTDAIDRVVPLAQCKTLNVANTSSAEETDMGVIKTDLSDINKVDATSQDTPVKQ